MVCAYAVRGASWAGRIGEADSLLIVAVGVQTILARGVDHVDHVDHLLSFADREEDPVRNH